MRAIGYIRVSKEKEEGYSPDTQLAKIRAYCDAQGLYLVDVYSDLDISGRTDDRPGWQAMLRRVAQGDIDRVVVYRLDRFSRDVADFMATLKRMREYGCEIASVNESFDTSTPMGRAMVGLLAVFAQLESETIGERIKDNLAQAVRSRGIHLGAKPPYGYSRHKGKLSVIPEQAEIVRWIYRQYLSGQGTRAIASQLTQRGVPAPRGGRVWRYTSVQTILENPVYMGVVRWNGHEGIQGHEPIIDRDTWLRTQRMMEARKGGPKKGATEGSIFGRLLVCAYCHRAGNIRYGFQRAVRYICSARGQSTRAVCGNIMLDGASLERVIVRRLLSDVTAAEWRQHTEAAKRHLLADEAQPDEVANLRRRRETLQRAIDRLFADHYEHCIITREQFAAANDRYLRELQAIDERLEELEQQAKARGIREADLELFLRHVSVLDGWDAMTQSERRAALGYLVKRIVWSPTEAVVQLQFGGELVLQYAEVRRGVGYFDTEHWPQCPICGKRARTPAGLSAHMTLHRAYHGR